MSALHHFYVVEAENGLVKVGFTTAAPEKRLQDLRTLIIRQYVLPCANARELEQRVYRQFAQQQQTGDWLKVSFDAVVAFVEEYVPEHNQLSF